MRKLIKFTIIIIVGIFLLMLIGCEKDAPIVRVNGIDVTIPRVILKDGKITMFVSVTDLKGNVVTDVASSNITVETIDEFGIIKKVNNFNLYSNPSVATPIAAALTMDYSGSMYFDTTFVPAMETAVKTFISLKGLTDQLEIIKFDDGVYVVQTFTTDTLLLYAAVDSTLQQLGGATAFYQACLSGLTDANVAVANTTNVLPAVIGFTDGVNNCQPLNPDTIISMALQLQIPVYTLGFGGTPTYIPDTVTLQHIADTTGGRYYWAPNANDIQQLYQYVNGQLTGAVVIGFPWGSKNNVIIRVTVKYQGYMDKAEKMLFY